MELQNHRFGLVCSTVANVSPASTKHDYRPADFLPPVKKPKAQTVGDKIRSAFGIPSRSAHGE